MYAIQYKWNQQLVQGEHWSCVGSVWFHPSDWSGLRLLFSHKALIVANLIFAYLFVIFKVFKVTNFAKWMNHQF